MMLAMSENICVIWCESDKRKIWPHLENRKAHNFTASMQKYDELEFKRTLHPHHSHDIIFSECVLFEYVKEKPKGCKSRSIVDLNNKRVSILKEILRDKKIEVFETYLRSYNALLNIIMPIIKRINIYLNKKNP